LNVPGEDRSVLPLFVLLLLLSSCGQPARENPPVVDEHSYPQRIISVVPSATEMLYALGLGDKVVGVGNYERFPPEVLTKPRIGGLLNPDIERIIELRPDLVITYGSQDVLSERLKSLGIRLYPFTHGNIDQTLQYLIALGTTTGADEKATEIVAHIRQILEQVRTNRVPGQPKVLLVHNRAAGTLDSLYSVGARAFQHELIAMAGGMNLFGDVDKEVVQPSLEDIISRSPDIIIETLPPPATAADLQQRRRDWETLRGVPAVVRNRIYVVADDYLVVPGPRLHLAALRIAELVAGKIDGSF
jgi:iron complex transport system substrate-binding protein